MEFVDLKRQYTAYKAEIETAVIGVIGGREIAELEKELSAMAGVKHCLGCSSGTDTLLLGLMAERIGPGVEVIVPDFTFIATAEVVSLLGAVPRFVDIDPRTYCLDPALVKAAVTPHTKGIIPVSLLGQCADIDAINEVAARHGLWVLEDAAQSFGAIYKGRLSCSLTRIAATSFFPAKPLGCYGDGGAVFTDDDDLANRLRRIRNHGQSERYRHVVLGINGRMDTLQAAVLLVKLRHYRRELEDRDRVARLYTEYLKDVAVVPELAISNTSTWAQYTLRVQNREVIRARLQSAGIPTAVHYPTPLHRQPLYASTGHGDSELPHATRASREVLSLPMHAFLTDSEVASIAAAVKEALLEC
jgi:UDP-2-acetamido-2-deoxy-ribo-hexuluronate aminotransferase